MDFLLPKFLSIFILIYFGLIPGSRIVDSKTVVLIHITELTFRSVEPLSIIAS